MKKFVVLDDFTGDHVEIEAISFEQAAMLRAVELGLKDCLEPVLVRTYCTTKINGARTFVDNGTRLGWGPGCKFDGQTPHNQVILTVFQR